MADHEEQDKRELSQEEIEDQEVDELPDREAMSILPTFNPTVPPYPIAADGVPTISRE